MAALQTTTYSAVSTTGAFDHPLAGAMQLAGINQGAKRYVVKYDTARIIKDSSSDGAVMLSYVPGRSGGLSIECQQTSALDKFLEYWTNLVQTAADSGDISDVASAIVLLRNGTTQHILTGVTPPATVPEKVYDSAGQYRKWDLIVADVVTL